MKQRLVNGTEWDVVSRWARKYYCSFQRAGVKSDIKTDMRRRARHEARQAIREGEYEAEELSALEAGRG